MINRIQNLSLKAKIVIATGLLMLLMSGGLVWLSLLGARNASQDLVEDLLGQKLRGDIAAMRELARMHYGEVHLVDGMLVDETGESLEGRNLLVDFMTENLGVVATLFVREGQDFRRISTNIRNADGSRAVGTRLGAASAAYRPMLDGSFFIGEAEILGQPYLCAYDPIISADNQVVGIYFIGIPVAEIDAFIQREMMELLRNVVFAFALMVCVSLAVLFVVVRKLTQPVAMTAKMLRDIAEGEGDLTQRLHVSPSFL